MDIMKYRIIKQGGVYKIQEKSFFGWKTWQVEECDRLGFMYEPYDVTFDTIEEARKAIPRKDKIKIIECIKR